MGCIMINDTAHFNLFSFLYLRSQSAVFIQKTAERHPAALLSIIINTVS
ncbi:hypothetical protein SAMN04488101_105142 [Pedobacter nyackensis]|uniref:Uncharacterized protein n=1 Tax=Pedobacter nyackensis TaxID=475255 RepID=A0A1W2D1F9_9SPHI|nr:hypothetical protein SAMN04488101_105142 [Pedobacter nyackensis]